MARIAIKASAINYFHALMVAGQYQTKPDLPFVPGVEVSGVIEFAPAGSSLNKGDRVTALLDSGGLTRGGYAEIADALPRRSIACQMPCPSTTPRPSRSS